MCPGEHPWITADLFAGAGGASEGIRQATGLHPAVAVNHWPRAVETHTVNHPTTRHLCCDVRTVRPREAHDGPLDLLWLSPDCFPAGTMVLTSSGYRPIETISIGDLVLTHTGRWRPVTARMHTVKSLVRISGHGHPGLCVSTEHPFFARSRVMVWSQQPPRQYRPVYSQPTWMRACDLAKGSYWATPVHFGDLPIPAIGGRGMAITPETMWLAGRYVADGWSRLDEKHGELVIVCGRHKANAFRVMAHQSLTWCHRSCETADQFSTAHRGLVAWLRMNFGHGAANKTIPGWALGMAYHLRRALLDGYCSGDGWRSDRVWEAETVSRSLAFGIKALACSLGHTATVHGSSTNRDTIQGRKVNALPIWKVRWRHENKHKYTMRDELHEWCPVRPAEHFVDESMVFNLSVAEDESYVVEGIVVHNCTHHSRARGGKPRDSGLRLLPEEAVRWARELRPRIVVLENVREITSWGPLDDAGQPIREREGELWCAMLDRLRRLGYAVEWRELCAADYGAPTTRRRLFLVARCDGVPIAWPEPTHGPGRAHPWRTAAEIIDWSLPCPSIFERRKPLAEATMRRIAEGIRRYVLEDPRPFLVPLNSECGHAAPRCRSIDLPLPTVMASTPKHALVAAFLARHYGGVVGQHVGVPLGTVTGQDHHSVVAAHLTKFYGTCTGSQLDAPAPTITGQGCHAGMVAALLIHYYGQGGQHQRLGEPLATIVGKARSGLVTVTVDGQEHVIADVGMRMLQPHELAAAQGFPEGYRLTGTKTERIKQIGNSVCPPVAAAIVRALMRSEQQSGQQHLALEIA